MDNSRLRTSLVGALSVALLGFLAFSSGMQPTAEAKEGSWFRSPANLAAARRLAKERGKPVLVLLR